MGGNLYNLLLTLHILGVVIAFAPTLVLPMLKRLRSKADSDKASPELALTMNDTLIIPGLVATSVLGVLLVVFSDGVFDMGEPWVSASFTIVLVLLLVAFFLLRPALVVQGTATDAGAVASANKRASMALGLFHLGLVVMVALMVWKPGA